MLSDFLRQSFKSKVISRANLNLNHWKVTETNVKRLFICESFRTAAFLMNVLSDLLTNTKSNFQIKNVYNQVEVEITGDLTQRDLDQIHRIEELYSIHFNITEKIVGCQLNRFANPERLLFKDNNQLLATSYRLSGNEYFQDEKLKLL